MYSIQYVLPCASPSQFPIFPHFLNLSPQISPSLSIFPPQISSSLTPSTRAYIYIIWRPLYSKSRLDMGIVYHKIRCKDMGFTYSLQIFNTFFSFLWANNENLAKKAEKQMNFRHFLR